MDSASRQCSYHANANRSLLSAPSARSNRIRKWRSGHAADTAGGRKIRAGSSGTALRMEGKSGAALKVFQEGLQHLPTVDSYGAEFLLHLSLGRSYQAAGQLKEAEREYEQASACSVRSADYLPFVYLRLAQGAKSQGELARMQWAVHCTESADAALDYPTGAARSAQQLLAATEAK